MMRPPGRQSGLQSQRSRPATAGLIRTMAISNTSSAILAMRRIALAAMGCALSLALVHVPATKAADGAASQPVADKAPSLPLAPSFEKVTGSEGGPYVLKLQNVSKDTVRASAKILLSVVFHSESKARLIPEHAIDPGQVWTITDLSAEDKVIITATGFAPLELAVP